MSSGLNAVIATRLEKAAVDNGFERPVGREGDWLAFGSSQCPMRIWLSSLGETVLLVAFSQLNVGRALGEYGTPLASPLPSGAVAGRTVTTIPALNALVRRAFQLAKTLPNELLRAFEKATASMPRTTEAERVIVQRVGQDFFRDALIEFWEGRCAVTGLAVKELLRASHIKPWAECESDDERLDAFNGLLLAPHLDAAFDRGFITVEDDGVVTCSRLLDEPARAVLGLTGGLKVRGLTDAHRAYLPWHRERVFRAERG